MVGLMAVGSVTSRPALRAVPPAAARPDSPRRARDRNAHKNSFRAGRHSNVGPMA